MGLQGISGSSIWTWGQSKKKNPARSAHGVLCPLRGTCWLCHIPLSHVCSLMAGRAGQAMGLSAKAYPGDADRAFPPPGRVLTEAFLCCQQPCALPWRHRFISLCLSRSLPHLHSQADSIWCKNQRDDARHGGRCWEGRRHGEPLADELLQFLPFEVQYFHLLPLTVVLRRLGLSSSSPAAARASLCVSTLAPLPSLLSPLRPPVHEWGFSGFILGPAMLLLLFRSYLHLKIIGWPPRRL